MQKAFGYTYDELKTSILPMAENGGGSIGATSTLKPSRFIFLIFRRSVIVRIGLLTFSTLQFFSVACNK